jgi:tetratricopeptide (TPR) repeat protein
MSVKVANNRFITYSFRSGFYQQILSDIVTLPGLGNLLIREAETAQILRQTEKLEETSIILSHFPLKDLRIIGHYYQGLSAYRRGEDARSIFERVAEQSKVYRAKALMSLAAVEAKDERYEHELNYFNQALKHTNNPSVIIEALRCIAVVKAKEGFHKSAVKDLENLFPLMRVADPNYYYQYLNSLAVELGEVGRIEEALKVCQITLASPYAFAYPEWRETGQDLALRGYKSRSSVRVIQTFPRNVVYLSEHQREPSDTSIHPNIFGSADVLSLKKWIKAKMVKEPNGDEIPPDADEKDLYLRIMELIAQKDLSVSELRQVIDFVEKLSKTGKG